MPGVLSTEVLIAGGGPVGLLLALLLRDRGVELLVIERQRQKHGLSRAIGIHPPSLEILDRIGLAAELVQRGVQVRRGVACHGARRLGSVSFSSCPPPFPFVLSLPQHDIERALRARLEREAPGALLSGRELVAIEERSAAAVAIFRDPSDAIRRCKAAVLVGCDGQHSLVRQLAHIPFPGQPYPEALLLADFDDDTEMGDDAAIFLEEEGLTESFPLPAGRRRWILGFPRPPARSTRDGVVQEVRHRLDHDLGATPFHGVARHSFHRHLAPCFARGRIALAGDAAHVISPIGGQGMNLGWHDAHDLASALAAALREGQPLERSLHEYGQRCRSRARQVSRRADMNTRMGRPTALHALRDGAVRCALNSPLQRIVASLFTMRGIGRWPI